MPKFKISLKAGCKMTAFKNLENHIRMMHEKAKGIDGKLILASYGENPETGEKLSPIVKHFNIGDVDGMIQAAIELSEEKHRNVYAPLNVLRADLPANKKGTEEDVVAILSFAADYDGGKGVNYQERCGDLIPSCVLETSLGNVQCFLFPDKPLLIEGEKDRAFAKELAAKITHNCDGADDCGKDISHVWRLPDLPNYPNQKKLKEGRSPEPFKVQIKKAFDGNTIPLLDFAKLPSVTMQASQNITVEVEYIKPVTLEDLPQTLQVQIIEGAETGQRSETVASVVTQLLDLQYGTGDIINCIREHPKGIGERYKGDLSLIEGDIIRLATKFSSSNRHATEVKTTYTMQAFEPINEADLKPREFVLGNHLIKGKVSVLVAPAGASKSTFGLMASVSVVTGQEILGIKVRQQGKVAIINNEDDMDEMHKRLLGICKKNGIRQSELKGKLFIQSGENVPFIIAKRKGKHDELSPYHKQDIIDYLLQHEISVLIVDPFLETHAGNENDNRDINVVCQMYREIAQKADCAVLIVHHTRKESGNSSKGHAGNADSGRGASSLVGAARCVITLYSMDKDSAKKHGIHESNRHQYVRLDDAKANLSLVSGRPKWFKRVSVTLDNFDDVGVLEPTYLDEKADNNELELIAALCQNTHFIDIRDMEGENIPRGLFREAMENSGVYLGPKTKTRSTIENRMEKMLMGEGITHHNCTIKMMKKSGHYYVQIELPEPEEIDIASLPEVAQKIIGKRENSIVLKDLPPSA
tara:strand:+ start:2023 stop:4290 length:2268 start_codon:yes stop_codon:yes gene_type:complete